MMKTFKSIGKTASLSPTKNIANPVKKHPIQPSHNESTSKPRISNKSPPTQYTKIITNTHSDKKLLRRQKSHHLISQLDKKEPPMLQQYRKVEKHSKSSDLNQMRAIILELLNKHAIQRKLTASEQYILTGYFAKYIEHAIRTPRLVKNPFNISKRLLSNNSPDMAIQPYVSSSSPRKRSQSKGKVAPKFTNKSSTQDIRGQLQKQLELIKFLWQVYLLKSLTCPSLSKLSAEEQTNNRHELLDMVSRLKVIQQKRNKMGEDKSLVELGKIMKRFQARITTLFL